MTRSRTDPLGRAIDARFALLGDGGSALVEVAQASGLALIAPEERDAEAASSGGTGELIAAAIDAGVGHVLVAAGGSATTDGGLGAIEAIARRRWPARRAHDGALRRAHAVRASRGGVRAAEGRRRGGGGAPDARLEAFGLPRGVPMTGAAGGLAGGLWARLGAELVAGAPFVLDAIDFDLRLRASRAVIVGEGRLDADEPAGQDRRRDRDARAPARGCPRTRSSAAARSSVSTPESSTSRRFSRPATRRRSRRRPLRSSA